MPRASKAKLPSDTTHPVRGAAPEHGKRGLNGKTNGHQSSQERSLDVQYYQIQRDSDDATDVDRVYACRCGAGNCRGSMLEAPARRAPNRVAGKNARNRPARRSVRTAPGR